jgi:hypothetical protein
VSQGFHDEGGTCDREAVDGRLDVVIVPVSDLDSVIAFHLDHDTRDEHQHVAQLTLPGSGCSIVVGDLPGQPHMAPGCLRGLQLVVADARAAREELLSRGVEANAIQVFDEREGGTSSGSPTPTAPPGRCNSSGSAARNRSSPTTIGTARGARRALRTVRPAAGA